MVKNCNDTMPIDKIGQKEKKGFTK